MLIDDIKTGRKQGWVFGSTSVGTSAVVLLGPSNTRTGLIISCPGSGNVTISNNPSVTAGNGIVLYSTGANLILTANYHGGLLNSTLYAIGSTGGLTIGYCELHDGAA